MNDGITFTDAETGKETFCNVRSLEDGVVGLAVSLRAGADVEVCLSGTEALRLADLLVTAGSAARGPAT